MLTMTSVILYLIESTIYLSVFIAFYMLLMRRTTFFRLNRLMFMAGMFTCLALPIVDIQMPFGQGIETPMSIIENMLNSSYTEQLEEITVDGASDRTLPLSILELIFISGALISLSLTIRSYYQMLQVIKSAAKTEKDGIIVRIIDKDTPSFSCGRNIVMSRTDLEENPAILTHERMHVKCRHSIDLFIYSAITILHWFNPLVWIARTELKMLHEYEADALTIKEGIDATQYQLLLVKKAVGVKRFQLANGFNHSKLKNRITMMYKEKTNKWMRLGYLVCIPFMAFTMCFCAQPNNKQNKAEVAAETVDQSTQEAQDFGTVEIKPTFNGGDANTFAQWIGSQLTYPEECKEEGISGRVVLSFTIGVDGKVSDVKVLRGVHEKLDAEAARIISMSPDWTPGMHEGKAVPVSFTIPIVFKAN